MQTAIGADPILKVQRFGQRREETQRLPGPVRQEVEVAAGRTQQYPAARSAIGQNQPPFFVQGLWLMPGQPVLMIEQDKMAVLAGMGAEKVADRGVCLLYTSRCV